MPTDFNVLTTNVEELEMELEEAKKEAQKYTDFVELLQQQLETAKRNVQFKSAHPETEAVAVHQAPDGSPIRKRKGKTNNQIYEEIFLSCSKPMHVTDILEAPMHVTDILEAPVHATDILGWAGLRDAGD